MLLEAAVMLELQEREVIGETAAPHAPRRQPALDRMEGHGQQPAEMEPEFLPDIQRAMGAEAAIGAVCQQDSCVIGRAVPDMLAHVAPMRGRVDQVGLDPFQRPLHLGDAEPHEAGIAVRAAALIGHPPGPQIAFLENMHGEAARPGTGHGLGMDEARIAVKHEIGDLQRVEPCLEPGGPIALRSGIGQIAHAAPIGLIAPVEPHAPDLGPGLAQHRAQLTEEGSMRPLQEEEATIVAGAAHHRVFACGPCLLISGVMAPDGVFPLAQKDARDWPRHKPR